MNKLIIIVLLTLLISSCTDINQMENSFAKIENLKKENDSLKKIVADIESKYVFDSISFREIYSKDNKYERNAEFNVELLVVGYNPNKSYFVKFDSLVDGKKINPDTLNQSNGGFKFKTKLTEKENIIRIDMNVENEYGQKKMGTLLETIRIKN
ncbi:hypothetical protein BZARG_2843 [Bizionia argentinensis JUB59]|uniref:Lipoprotein n=1 Tax=Bizionia argentinensis JUB59 TaxID=1046627 RepID=G2EDB1_9FLAO|nr:hypothetical protein [Bizionia argentinensis]EGV43565.2 hypothetical protein BZARG_2843 [Bizionia argentinensis JUB59]